MAAQSFSHHTGSNLIMLKFVILKMTKKADNNSYIFIEFNKCSVLNNVLSKRCYIKNSAT